MCILCFIALQLSKALVSHIYGVFPTHGYSKDSMYPQTFNVGQTVLENGGCSLTGQVKKRHQFIYLSHNHTFSFFVHYIFMTERLQRNKIFFAITNLLMK